MSGRPPAPGTFDRVATVARWQPVHLGHRAVLRALLARSHRILVGVGSSNRRDARNPFTFEERSEMIRLVLPSSHACELLAIPDLGDGPRWRAMVCELFGPVDAVVTANPYVAHLLAGDYPVIHPITLVPEHERRPIDGTMVRRFMARGDDWQRLVPPEVADYLSTGELDRRFRREFGLETLALEAP